MDVAEPAALGQIWNDVIVMMAWGDGAGRIGEWK